MNKIKHFRKFFTLLSIILISISFVSIAGVGSTHAQEPDKSSSSFSPGAKNDISFRPDSTIRRTESRVDNWYRDNITWENHGSHYEIWRLDNSGSKDYLIENILANRLEDYLLTAEKLYVQHQVPSDAVYLYDLNVVDSQFKYSEKLDRWLSMYPKYKGDIKAKESVMQSVEMFQEAENNLPILTGSGLSQTEPSTESSPTKKNLPYVSLFLIGLMAIFWGVEDER